MEASFLATCRTMSNWLPACWLPVLCCVLLPACWLPVLCCVFLALPFIHAKLHAHRQTKAVESKRKEVLLKLEKMQLGCDVCHQTWLDFNATKWQQSFTKTGWKIFIIISDDLMLLLVYSTIRCSNQCFWGTPNPGKKFTSTSTTTSRFGQSNLPKWFFLLCFHGWNHQWKQWASWELTTKKPRFYGSIFQQSALWARWSESSSCKLSVGWWQQSHRTRSVWFCKQTGLGKRKGPVFSYRERQFPCSSSKIWINHKS